MDSKCAVIIDSLHLTSMTSASKNLGILAQIFGCTYVRTPAIENTAKYCSSNEQEWSSIQMNYISWTHRISTLHYKWEIQCYNQSLVTATAQ